MGEMINYANGLNITAEKIPMQFPLKSQLDKNKTGRFSRLQYTKQAAESFLSEHGRKFTMSSRLVKENFLISKNQIIEIYVR